MFEYHPKNYLGSAYQFNQMCRIPAQISRLVESPSKERLAESRACCMGCNLQRGSTSICKRVWIKV